MADGCQIFYSYFWLRDNCHCHLCFHSVCSQRQINTVKIPQNIQPLSVFLSPSGHELHVEWAEEDFYYNSPVTQSPKTHKSHYSVKDLAARKAAYDIISGAHGRNYGKQLWTADLTHTHTASLAPAVPLKLSDIAYIEYSEIMESDDKLLQFLEILHRFGLAIISDAPIHPERTFDFGRRIAPLKRNFYGEVWDIYQRKSCDYSFADTAYTNLAIGLHTDNCYWHDGAGLQLFHILQQAEEGGFTLLADGFHIAEKLRQKNKQAFDMLSTMSIPYHCLDDSSEICFMQRCPLIHTDEYGNYIQIRYNNHDRTPAYLPPAISEKFYESYRLFLAEMNDPNNFLRLLLKPGMILITDNWRVVHGREGFEGERRMCGAYVSHDEYMGRLLALRRKFS